MLYRKIILVICLLAFSGCAAAIRMPDHEEANSIKNSNKSLALLRLSADLDNSPLFILKAYGIERYMMNLASIDAGLSPKSVMPFISPSEEAQGKGWIYLTLEPGMTYYLGVWTPVSDYNETAKYSRSPDSTYWVNIPKEGQVLYLGTLYTSCKGKKGFWGTTIEKCSNVSIIDESSAAQLVAQKSFPHIGPMTTSLLHWNREPVEAKLTEDLFPMGLLSKETENFMSPNWSSRGIGLATGGEETLKAALQFREAGLFLYLLYLPFGIIGGAISGEVNAGRWNECIEGLQKNIGDFTASEILLSTLNDTVPKSYAAKIISLDKENNIFERADQQGLKSILQIEMLRVQLVECNDRGTFCIEAALRARLWNIAGQVLLYDAVHY